MTKEKVLAIKVIYIFVFLSFIPLAYLTYDVYQSMTAFYFFIGYVAIHSALAFTITKIKCPQCGEKFHKDDGYIHFNFKCYNCGLSLFEKSGITQGHKSNCKFKKPETEVQIGNRILFIGGYDYEPIFLQDPPNQERIGEVIKFIPGQNEIEAAVVKLDLPITAKGKTGQYLVLEIRHEGQTWKTNGPVHLELCDFIPENKVWGERPSGEWIESHANFNILEDT